MHHNTETPFSRLSNAFFFLLACALWAAVILLAVKAV